MSAPLDKSLLEEVSLIKFGTKEAYIEKDWFVTKVIKILAENHYLNFSIVFTGGTCLSKAHKIIERFSEDIDFRVIAPNLENQGVSKVRKVLSGFKNHVKELLEQEFEVLDTIARDGNRHIMILLAFPTVCEPDEGLRPHIKLELTLSNLLLPSVELPISSFINEVSGKAAEVKKIACINPVENAADKLSAIVWRIPSRVRGEGDKQPDVVRHLHDLAKLSEHVLGHESFAELAKATIERDENRAEQLKGLSTQAKLATMIGILETDSKYPQEYDTYVKGMVHNYTVSVPSFGEALNKLKLLIEKIK